MKVLLTCSYKLSTSSWKAFTKISGGLAPFLLLSSWSLAQEPAFLPEMQDILRSTFCKTGDLPQRQDLWQSLHYESSNSFQSIKPKQGKAIPTNKLALAALKIAKKKKHRSYSHGICKNGSGWIFSSPADHRVFSQKKEVLSFNLKQAQRSCRNIKIDFAHGERDETRRLYRWTPKKTLKSPIKINTAFLDSGVISFTCTPLAKHEGHELWFMLPIKSPPQDPPFISLVSRTDISSLGLWVNALRKEFGLSPVADNNEFLNKSSERLAKKMTVKHDRRILKQEQKALSDHQLKLLGENRVEGENARDMAWLLWNSPRHRNLVLNPNATHLSIGNRAQNQRSLAVLVFAMEKGSM